jgi:hypothetical protein
MQHGVPLAKTSASLLTEYEGFVKEANAWHMARFPHQASGTSEPESESGYKANKVSGL